MSKENDSIIVDQSTIEKISEMAISAKSIQIHEGTHQLVIPEKYKSTDITEQVLAQLEHPKRKKGTVQLGDMESFLLYLKQQANVGDTYIYANIDTRTFSAVINDHEKISESANSAPAAGWKDFKAIYKSELTRECSIWLSQNRQNKEQEEFAIFLEDNISDICEPSGENLLKIALTLQAKTEVNFSASKRLENGQTQLNYTENINASAGDGSIEIPRQFTIGLRIFKNGDGYKIQARLKYRLTHSKVKFWYELDRPEDAIEDAFKKYIEKAKESGFTVLISGQ